MNRNEKRTNKLEIIIRLAKRLPEIIIIALLLFTGACIWMETPNALYANEFAFHSLFDYTHDLGYIPLIQKLIFTIPALLLVFLFTEDIIKVSILNEPLSDEPV